jgi:hypothetical protein
LLSGAGTLHANLIVNGGPVQVNSSTDALIVTGDYMQLAGTVTVVGSLTVNGLMTWSGTINGGGRVIAHGGLALAGNSDKILDGETLINEGMATWTGFGNLVMSNGAVFNNLQGAVFDAQNDAAIVAGGGAAPSFVNAGTFLKSATTGLATTIGVAFSNSGTVQAQAGTLFLSGPFSNFANNTLTGGTYQVSATLKFNNADIRTNAANLLLTGTNSQIVNQTGGDGLANFATNAMGASLTLLNGRNLTTPGALNNAGSITIGAGSTLTVTGDETQTAGSTSLAGGMLTVTGMVNVQGGNLIGSGSIIGNVRNAGRVSPGASNAAGLLTITGNYTQTAAGILDIKIGGPNAGTDFDQVNINGTATLDGILNVSLLDPFFPMQGDQFQIILFGSRLGDFAVKNGLDLGMGLRFDPQYDTASLTLVTVATGAPSGGHGHGGQPIVVSGSVLALPPANSIRPDSRNSLAVLEAGNEEMLVASAFRDWFFATAAKHSSEDLLGSGSDWLLFA